MGMALWILEAYIVLLDATDLNNVKGCTITPPYLDEYGEPDPGLRYKLARLEQSRVSLPSHMGGEKALSLLPCGLGMRLDLEEWVCVCVCV